MITPPTPQRGLPPGFEIPELGMKGVRYFSAEAVALLIPWRNEHQKHLYELHLRRSAAGDAWIATATNDGHRVFRLEHKNKSMCERCAIAAMGAYLIKGHRKTWRKARQEASSESFNV